VSRILKALEIARRGRGQSGPDDSLSRTASRRKLQIDTEFDSGAGKRLAELNIPRLSPSAEVLTENRVVSSVFDSKSGAVDAYKMLRTKALRRLVTNRWQVLAVTSTVQGEGKTLTALNLALSISQDPNVDVVLVDGDLRSPSIQGLLGIEPRAGLYEYLEGSANLEDVLVSPDVPGLAVIPNSHPVENSAEALTGPRMGQLMSELRSLSPSVIVIVDMPPLIVDDVLAFAPLVDAMLLVFRTGVTSREDIATARELTADLPVLGCILNASMSTESGSYY
jgi:protein-tyrosine kinase